MPIKISKWYGRLGNNIQQCAVGIMIAKQRNDTFQNLRHDIIKPIYLDFRKDKKNDLCKIYLNDFFYWNGYIRSPNISSYKLYKEVQEICQTYILHKLDIPKISLPQETLVIHIRSGDVFAEGMDFYNFIPNPYVYYLKLINLYDEVLIVTEKDKNNPVINKLKDNPKVTIQSKSVKEDFSTLLGAKNLATSGTSTFPIAASLCSLNLENLYCSENMEKTAINYKMISDPRVNVYVCKFNNYIKKGSWKNNSKQKAFILDAKIVINFIKLKKNNFKLLLETLSVDMNLIFMKFVKLNIFIYKKLKKISK